jgi:hypothetical protein
MLHRLFENTVSAICYEIAGIHADGNEDLAAPFNDVTRFALREHGKMPRILGAGIQLATLLFALMALGRHGTVFHRLPPRRRHVQVAAWTTSRLGSCRDLMKFYSSLVILALYSRLQLAQSLAQAQGQAE